MPVPPTVFTALDSTDAHVRAQLIGMLDRMAASPDIQRVRQRAEEAFAPRGGQHLLRHAGHAGRPGLLHGSRVGRTRHRRLVRAGLTEVTAEPVTLAFTDPGRAGALLGMIDPQVPAEARFVPDDRRAEWFGAVDAAGQRGDFLAALTVWVAAGTRPGP